MKITIKTITGKVYPLDDVEPGLTVKDLKLLTQKQTEIEPECQRLIFKGKVLKDEQSLTDASLSDGDCIIVVKSRKKKKRTPPEEKNDAAASEPSVNANAPQPLNTQSNSAFGFMGQGQNPALFGAFNQQGFQQPAANAQQPATAADMNVNSQPAANPFAALMGMRGNNQMPDMNAMMQMMQNPAIQQLLNSPQMQEHMRQIMQNPQMMNHLMNNLMQNPLVSQMIPQMMGNNQAFRHAAAGTAPQAANASGAVSEPQSESTQAAADALNGAAVSNPAAANSNEVPANQSVPGNQPSDTNSQQNVTQPNPLAALISQMGQEQPNNGQPNSLNPFLAMLNAQGQMQPNNGQTNAPNPFLAMLNAQSLNQQPVAQPQILNDAQARELYAEQLEQLSNMGFLDEARNLRSLRETGGSVEAAIILLFQ